jgi:hypothetical protein
MVSLDEVQLEPKKLPKQQKDTKSQDRNESNASSVINPPPAKHALEDI